MISPESLQLPPHEALPEQAFEGLLGGVANHEAKALTLAFLAMHPENAYTMSELSKNMTKLQGAQPAWEQARTVAFRYCERSLGPIGCVAKELVKTSHGTSQPAYKATDFGKETGLASAGAVLDWSLRHPSISVQEILGATQSRTNSRAPINRFRILTSILTTKTDSASFGEISEDHRDPELGKILASASDSLTLEKVFDISSNKINYDPLIAINDASYNGKKAFDAITPERQAIYQALGFLVHKGTVPLSEIIRVSYELKSDANISKIRNLLLQGIAPSHQTPQGGAVSGISAKDRGKLGEEKESVISIKKEHKEAIRDFVNTMLQIQNNENQASFRSRAQEIVNNHDECRTIMQKALEHSPSARASRRTKSLGQSIVKLLSTEPEQSTKQMHESLEAQGIEVSKSAIRNSLKKIEENQALLKQEKFVLKDGRKQKQIYYSIAESK